MLTIIFVVLTTIVKLFNELFAYYNYNLSIHFSNQSPKFIVMLIISLVLDNAYALLIYSIRDYFAPKDKYQSSLEILVAITKWSLIFFTIYAVMVGELGYLITQIHRYPFLVYPLLKSCILSFVGEFIIYWMIMNY